MVKQPIEQRRGKNLVSSQKVSPPSKAGIGSQNDRPVLVASGDQLEEVASLLLRELRVAHFIDDQQTGGDVAAQALSHQAGMGSTLQGLRQFGERW